MYKTLEPTQAAPAIIHSYFHNGIQNIVNNKKKMRTRIEDFRKKVTVKPSRTRSAPSNRRSAPSKKRSIPNLDHININKPRSISNLDLININIPRSIPNLDQINLNIPRTPCLDQLPKNLHPHLRRLLWSINSTPKHIGYTQGDNIIAVTLLRLTHLNKKRSINDAYEIFASAGMRRFRMLNPMCRIKFINEVSPLFTLFPSSLQLNHIQAAFSHVFYGYGTVGKNQSSCYPKLLMTLLSHDVEFFKYKHEFVNFYLFILKHLSISVVDDFQMNGERNMMQNPTSLQTYTNYIEDLTLKSINSMSISKNTLSGYFNNNNHKYKCHIIAAYAVMLLDKVLGVNSKINTSNIQVYTSKILSEINYAIGLIHNSSICEGMPNLQGIRPILQKVDIYLKTQIPWHVIQFARMFGAGVSSKLLLAQHVLGLPLVPINRKSSVGKHLTTIFYVDKKRRNTVTLYDAVKNSGRPRRA
jgi:hypothetical protein